MGETNRNCFVFSLLVIRSRRKTATGNGRAATPPHISYAGTPTMSFQCSYCSHFPSTPDLPYTSVGSSCASIPVPPSRAQGGPRVCLRCPCRVFGQPMAPPAWTIACLSQGDRDRQCPGRGHFHKQQHCQAARAYGELAGIPDCSCRVVFLRVKLITEPRNYARGEVTAPAVTSPPATLPGSCGARSQAPILGSVRCLQHFLLPALQPSHPGCLMTSGSAATPSRCLPAAHGHGHRW